MVKAEFPLPQASSSSHACYVNALLNTRIGDRQHGLNDFIPEGYRLTKDLRQGLEMPEGSKGVFNNDTGSGKRLIELILLLFERLALDFLKGVITLCSGRSS